MKNTTHSIQEALSNMAPIAIYNTAVPECIAIFKERSALVKYLLGEDMCPESVSKAVNKAINKKTKIRPATTKLGLQLAIRYANSQQLQRLGNQEAVVIVPYIPAVKFNELIAFNSSRLALAEDHNRPGLTQPNAVKKAQHKNMILHPVAWRDTNPLSRYDYAH
jgi:hypothetical protein